MTKKELATAINAQGDTPLTPTEIKKHTLKELEAMLAQFSETPEVEAAPVKPAPEPKTQVASTLTTIGNAVSKATGKAPKIICRKSTVADPCLVVWNMCESMKLGADGGARRKDVLIACENAGVAHYTARTQIQLWKKAQAVA